MKKQNGKVMSAAVLTVGLLVTGRAIAGSLDPTNAPGPTMHSLEEIYQKVSAISIVQTNIVVVTNNTVASVAKTGQTMSYATDDDGALQKGVAWPNPRFTVGANTNVVSDNLTGLMWARNANLFGTTNWGVAVANCNNLDYGGYTDWRLPNVRELLSLIDYNWCNPALCNMAGTGQWTENDPFTGVPTSIELQLYYWSSTTVLLYPDHAWRLHIYHGVTDGGRKLYDGPYYVWPVRGGQ